ncbi:uncharacterized protein LOC144534489 isoform X2 [Sander vitreus]
MPSHIKYPDGNSEFISSNGCIHNPAQAFKKLNQKPGLDASLRRQQQCLGSFPVCHQTLQMDLETPHIKLLLMIQTHRNILFGFSCRETTHSLLAEGRQTSYTSCFL